MVKKKSSSFAEQLAELSNPAPSLDPEAADSDTEAKIVDFDDDSSADEFSNGHQPSQLRKLTSLPLSEGDKRYAGLTTSRDDWLAADSESGSGSDDNDDEEDDSEGEEEEVGGSSNDKTTSDNLMSNFNKISAEIDEESEHGSDSSDEEQPEAGEKGLTQKKAVHARELLDMSDDIKRSSEEDEEDDSEIEEEDESADESKEEEEEDDTGFSSEENETAVKSFAPGSLQDELQRGKATKAQLGLWDNLLESRIKLQKALSLTNQMAQHDTLDEFVDQGGEHLEEALSKGREELKNLVSAMIELQDTLLLHNPDTTHVLDGSKQDTLKHSDGENEEIPSDDEEISNDDEEIPSEDEEISSDDEVAIHRAKKAGKQSHKGNKFQGGVKRKIDEAEFGEHLAKRHKDFEEYRNTAIQKWHDRTKLASGKISSKSFSSFDKYPLAQIQQVLQDKVRLIKRTQLKRTSYKVLGKADEDDKEMKQEEAMASHNSHLKDYDAEIFDDDDFYHQLLRELIEKKTADTSDPVQLTRQWLEVQKLRSKVKKRVDTKASKGRKLRYDVHQKLVSFMAPIDGCDMTDDARNELYGSLFGQQRKFNLTEVAER